MSNCIIDLGTLPTVYAPSQVQIPSRDTILRALMDPRTGEVYGADVLSIGKNGLGCVTSLKLSSHELYMLRNVGNGIIIDWRSSSGQYSLTASVSNGSVSFDADSIPLASVKLEEPKHIHGGICFFPAGYDLFDAREYVMNKHVAFLDSDLERVKKAYAAVKMEEL